MAGPEEVECLDLAYRNVPRSIYLVDRDDPIAEIVAWAVIGVGATGVRDPAEICRMATRRLGF